MSVARSKQEPKTRKDPRHAQADGVSPLAHLSNKDPDRSYLWVNMNDSVGGVDYYLSLGYRVEERREGGVGQGFAVAKNPFRKDNDPSESYFIFQGLVLMSVDSARAQEIAEHGAYGNSGQRSADVLARRINGPQFGKSLIRDIPGLMGRDGPVLHVENETTEESSVGYLRTRRPEEQRADADL